MIPPKMLAQMGEIVLMASQKLVDPPIIVDGTGQIIQRNDVAWRFVCFWCGFVAGALAMWIWPSSV